MSSKYQDTLTEVILKIFRLNGALIENGNQLVKPLGLTSARWQILGAIATNNNPTSCPQIAKMMGITRQGALKQLDLLEEEGLVEAIENEKNERSPLFDLTPKGRKQYASAMKLQEKWVLKLMKNLNQEDIKSTASTLGQLIMNLEDPQQRGVAKKYESISKMLS
jgi:DNA-binding MarR family transcriptional regulator